MSDAGRRSGVGVGRPLRVLIIEDSESDALLLVRALGRSFELTFERVETAEAMSAALSRAPWDVICADYSLPGFDALGALALRQERCPDVPFLIVSGSVGEDNAVAAMKAGANDYLFKDNLARLGPAIERELRDAAVRRERRQGEEERRELVERLQEAVRVRDEFLSIASHELRTPLTSMSLLVQGLLRAQTRGTASFEAAGASKLELAMRQIRRLERLVADLLNVSRIVNGRLTLVPQEIDLGALLRELATRFEDSLRAAECELRLDLPEAVPVIGRWDPSRIEDVLTNLLSNAMKYGAGKPIEVSVRRDGACAVVRIRDHGLGIAKEDQGRIFDRFERAVSSSHYGGLGLGLWISRGIVKAHEGAISVESRLGEGATFIVTLPVDRLPR